MNVVWLVKEMFVATFPEANSLLLLIMKYAVNFILREPYPVKTENMCHYIKSLLLTIISTLTRYSYLIQMTYYLYAVTLWGQILYCSLFKSFMYYYLVSGYEYNMQ